MSLVLLGILNSQAAGAGGAYYLSLLATSASESGYGIALDSSQNVYGCGVVPNPSTNDSILVKYDNAGAVQWQVTLGGTANDIGRQVKIDSNDNIYVGITYDSGSLGDAFVLAKYNSSGTIQWQRQVNGNGNEQVFGLAIDSNDDIYVSGLTLAAGQGFRDYFLVKYNSSGTIQWQRTLGETSSNTNDYGQKIATDSSNNVYITGYTTAGLGGNSGGVVTAKYNSSGTLQWQRYLSSPNTDRGFAVAVDSNDDLYVGARSQNPGLGGDDIVLAKYNSSGTLQWQKYLGGTGSEEPTDLVTDSANNIYLAGFGSTASEGSNDCIIVKYNSSGTVQWQRRLGSTLNDNANAIALDPSGNIYIGGFLTQSATNNRSILTALLPNDGSLTGTYDLDGDDVVYAESTLSSGTSSLSSGTSGFTSQSESEAESASSLTAGTYSATQTLVSL